MSSKYGEHYTGHCNSRRLSWRRLLSFLLSFLLLILVAILIIFLVFHPTKPEFYLRNLSLSQLTLTQPSNVLTTTLQATLSSRNPNARVSVLYDSLHVYSVYKNQRVTVTTEMPSGYQGHKDMSVWSPFLYGTAVPVSADVAEALVEDENAGFILMDVKVEGRLRWKVGSWVSGHYHVYVNCPAILISGSTAGDHGTKGDDGSGLVFGLKFRGMTSCSVDV